MSTATWADLRAFFHADKWTPDRNTGDQQFEKTLPGERVLRSKRSMGKDDEAIGKDLFRWILRVQLEVSEKAFWKAIRTGNPVQRPSAELPELPPTLPPWLIAALKREVGLREEEVANLSREQADAKLSAKRSRHQPSLPNSE